MEWNRKNVENLILVTMIITFSGQIYLSPLPSVFRLSMAVAALTVTLIHFQKLPVMLVCGTIAFTIPLFRAFVDYMSISSVGFIQLFWIYAPVAIYYFSYGILFEFLQIRKKLQSPMLFMFSLWFVDSFSNLMELSLRQLLNRTEIGDTILQIIVIGMVRTVLTYFLYNTTIYYIERYDRSLKEKKYRETLLFLSRLKSELFFIRKSITDIEEAMKESYSLYRQLEPGVFKEQALSVTKNIHEIKKDYARVVEGIEKTLAGEEDFSLMSIREIFELLKENYISLADSKNLEIRFVFQCRTNIMTSEYYPLVSILNNLIINALEAIEEDGAIVVKSYQDKDYYHFQVMDNGKGFDPKDLELLFLPGYSTKYDEVTGKMSTGIGLSHVKEIVENHFSGIIQVDTLHQKKWTRFWIQIPVKRIWEVAS
ncbi:sensor histidine kinase [Tindallia californiensis]|uniref:Two-component system, sensor histidine kinase YcbA n=1 Tax=Tindallia californiensis TaxID=159292 RepID=A0A1H3J1W6_9FIRM|nr:sensor histidine kinase [Tindallia californiensis]SDY34000.1 two-component system, sensor histidine kinase YcbA [Tindallia californiensis]